jgi:hypothetical protein
MALNETPKCNETVKLRSGEAARCKCQRESAFYVKALAMSHPPSSSAAATTAAPLLPNVPLTHDPEDSVAHTRRLCMA